MTSMEFERISASVMFQRILAAVGLRHQEIVEFHAHDARIFRIERVLHVDERSQAAAALGFRDYAQAERGLAGRFRPEDPMMRPRGSPPTPRARSDGERAGRDRVNDHARRAAKAHDRPFAELLGDGGDRELDVLGPGGIGHAFGSRAAASRRLEILRAGLSTWCLDALEIWSNGKPRLRAKKMVRVEPGKLFPKPPVAQTKRSLLAACRADALQSARFQWLAPLEEESWRRDVPSPLFQGMHATGTLRLHDSMRSSPDDRNVGTSQRTAATRLPD